MLNLIEHFLIGTYPRSRGEYVLLMHYTGSSPAGEHRDRGRIERSQDLTNVSPHSTSARHCDTWGAILKQWGHVE